MTAFRLRATAACIAVLVGTLAIADRSTCVMEGRIDHHAAEYVKIVADLAAYDPDSVDFVPSPKQNRGDSSTGATTRAHSGVEAVRSIKSRSQALAAHLRASHGGPGAAARATGLAAQLDSIAFRIEQLAGDRRSFEQEAKLLFGTVPGDLPEPQSRTEQALERLSDLLPGRGRLSERLAAYQRRFIVTRGRLHDVVTSSVAACREKTKAFVTLPDDEGLRVEYVADRPWMGYSTYLGRFRSVMQVNRATPMTVGQVLFLACHEGYPGHHLYNTLREQHLVQERGWTEASALPVFSPEGFTAEALANAAAAMTFSEEERLRLFAQKLFPAAGLDSAEARRYDWISGLVDDLAQEVTAALIGYLSGRLTRADAVAHLQHRAAMERPEALIAYVDRYGAYALAYTWGRERYLSELNAHPTEARWARLEELMASREIPAKSPAFRDSDGNLGGEQEILGQDFADDHGEEVHVENSGR